MIAIRNGIRIFPVALQMMINSHFPANPATRHSTSFSLQGKYRIPANPYEPPVSLSHCQLQASASRQAPELAVAGCVKNSERRTQYPDKLWFISRTVIPSLSSPSPRGLRWNLQHRMRTTAVSKVSCASLSLRCPFFHLHTFIDHGVLSRLVVCPPSPPFCLSIISVASASCGFPVKAAAYNARSQGKVLT